MNKKQIGWAYLHQVFSGEQRQTDMLHQVGQVFLSDIFVMVDPSDHCFKHLCRNTDMHKAEVCVSAESSTRAGGGVHLLL